MNMQNKFTVFTALFALCLSPLFAQGQEIEMRRLVPWSELQIAQLLVTGLPLMN